MINENNPFQIALKSISTLKDAIVLLSCLLKVKELNREQYFYNGNSQESFLFKFLNKKFIDYYESDIEFNNFFELCKKTGSKWMDINYVLNNIYIFESEDNQKRVSFQEIVLKNKHHSTGLKKEILKRLDKKTLLKDEGFESIVISFAKNNEVELLQYLIDEKVIDVNKSYSNSIIKATIPYYINSYVYFKKFLEANSHFDMTILSEKRLDNSKNSQEDYLKTYCNIYHKLMNLTNQYTSGNAKKKTSESFSKFKILFDIFENYSKFENTQEVQISFFNFINESLESNEKIATFFIKNKKYQKLIFSSSDNNKLLIKSAFTHGAYTFLNYVMKHNLIDIYSTINKNELLLYFLIKPENIKKYTKSQTEFINNSINFLFNNFFNTEEITHDVLDTVFKNTQQNLSINLNHNNDGSLNVSLSNNTNYYAREYNIVNLLAYNIEHKKLDILKKYEYLNNQSYLSKLFYEIIKNGENLTDFFFYGNESQSQYKGFESLSLENKKLFFNELSSNLYLSFFESKYVEKNPEFDRKNIIKINHHQVIKNILHCLFKMTKNFDINEFPIDFFDKEATMFLMDELKKSAFNLNSNQVNNMLTSIESSIEKRKLESIIANDKLVKSNKKKI